MPKYGKFINPVPHDLLDLRNDTTYLSVKKYILNKETFANASSFVINDINPNSKIVNISLNVETPFESDANNDSIEIINDNGKILFSKNSNSMNVTGKYATDCYYTTSGNENELIVNYSTDKPSEDKPSELFVTISYSNSRSWTSVCYGNGKFVAVAGNNSKYFAYSTDGINWTEGTISSTSRSWRSVCYGNDKFVTVAESTNYYAYSNGILNEIPSDAVILNPTENVE